MSYGDYLPMYQRNSGVSARLRPRFLITALKYIIPCILIFILYWFYNHELHVELAPYSRDWVHQEMEPVKEIAGCFTKGRVSDKYNISEALYGARHNEIQAGMSLRFGLDCYELAGTIQSLSNIKGDTKPSSDEERVQYHTYWRSDSATFGVSQEWMIKSFLATQNIHTSRLVLWSNGDLSGNEVLGKYIRRFPHTFALRTVNLANLAVGTALEKSRLLKKDAKGQPDENLIRLLVLWNYGGVWFDMDSLLTRDLEPLLEHEFVTQWDCYDKRDFPLNGALMRFRQHSPYLCEAFHILATDPPPRSGSADWGSVLYHELYRRLVAATIPPFKVLPFCFSDGRSCRLDNRLPDPFVADDARWKWTSGLGMEENGLLDAVLGKIFSVNLHNKWHKKFPKNGWVERLLLRKYERKLNAREQGNES